MKVAFDGRSLTSPALRGWDRYTVGLVRELVERGVEVVLLHRPEAPVREEHVRGLGCRTQAVEARRGLVWEQVALPLALLRGGFDVYHAPCEHGVPLVAPCPTVLTVHSVTVHSYHSLIQRGLLPGTVRDYTGEDYAPRSFSTLYMDAQCRRAGHILTPSEFARSEVVELLGQPARKVSTTLLAAHEHFLREPRPPEAREALLRRMGIRSPFLLYVGGYERHKNTEGVLEAFRLVRDARPDVQLVLVGTKELPDALRSRVERLGLRPGEDVVFQVNLGEELADLYDEAAALVTLSWRETFCLPLLEAMTRGLPFVASRWGAAPEVAGDEGELVDPRDTHAAKEALLRVLSLDKAAVSPRLRARAARFSWARCAEQTLDVYRSLL
ncbi:glycosyltransferase family 1 protein [Myxococcaceae bacterium GXIMD 01537]